MINKKESEKDTSVLKWAIIRFAISVAAALIAVGIYVAATKDEAKEGRQEAQTAVVTNQEVIDAIVKSCEKNGNPLREVVQSILREEIVQLQDRELYERLLPEADPEELDKLIGMKAQRNQHRLDRIEPLNCRNQYPNPDERKGAP